jgi:hypothetical protein
MFLDLPPFTLFCLAIGILFIVGILVLWTSLVSPGLRAWFSRGVVYIIVSRSVGVSSRPHAGHARQYLNLLSQQGVRPRYAWAFLPAPLAGGLAVENPSPHIGLPPLGVPLEYRPYIKSCTEDTADQVRQLIRAFASSKSIARIVLICDGEGSAESLGLTGDAKITVADMADYCTYASKPLLVVLDASYSTVFAEKTIEELERRGVSDRVDVGFLTSGRGRCFTSAVVISSSDPELLVPGSGCEWTINSSMFSRALLSGLAYRFEGHWGVTLADIPRRLNVAGAEMKNGFEAAFVSTQSSLGQRSLRYFFPWGRIGAGEMSRVNPTVPFTHVIPNDELGALFDDIGNVWGERGPTAHSVDSVFFCDVSISTDGVTVTQRGVLSGRVPEQAALLEHLRAQDKASRKRSCAIRVPFEPIADIVCARLNAHSGFSPAFLANATPDCPWYRELYQFVADLNGKVLSHQYGQVYRISRRCCCISQEDAFQMIVAARKEVARQLNIDLEVE